MRALNHNETIADYSYQLPFEVDKSKAIGEMPRDELQKLIDRLRLEREAESLVLDLKRNSGEKWTYENPPPVDTTTPINQMYHHGIPGMKWGVRKDRKRTGNKIVTKTTVEKIPASDDHKESRTFKSKATTGLSTTELRKLNERLQLEKTYKELTKTEKKRGKKLVEDILYKSADSTLTAVASAASLYAVKKMIGKSMGEDVLKEMFPAKKSK
jgi:hypothetical protein